MSSFWRKGKRRAENQKKKTRKARNKEARKQESIYRKNRAYSEMFSTEEERNDALDELFDRYKNGEELTLKEVDILCSSMYPEHREKYSICDDVRFSWLYLMHFDAGQNNYSLPREAEDQLDDFVAEWKDWIWDDEMSDDRVYIELRKETKDTIKKMRKSLAKNGVSQNELEEKEKEIMLRSKSIYIKIQNILENLGVDHLSLNMCGEEIHIDEFSLIHSFFRHYSELTKQYDDNKSYFTPEINAEQFSIILKEKILDLIEDTGVIGNHLPQSIFIKYYGRLYRIYFNEKFVDNGNRKVWRVNTFYPVEQEKDLVASRQYDYYKIRNNLSVGI